MAMNDFEILYARSPIAGPRPVMKKFVSGDQIIKGTIIDKRDEWIGNT